MDGTTEKARRRGVALVLALVACTGLWGPAARAAETTTYVLTDVQGTVLAREDAHGNIIARYDYRPYGKQQTGPVAAGPGYTGHVEDPDTGLVYMQQRYYDPEVGRFSSVDPVAVDGNTGGNFNRYWYAGNNPIKFTDPDGRCFWDGCIVEAMAVGFVVGVVIDVVAQKVVNPQGDISVSSALVSGAVGAVTGGSGAVFTGAAARGSITVTQAVIRQAGASAAAGAAGAAGGDIADGKTPTLQRTLNAAGAGAVGSLAGSAVSASTGSLSRTATAGNLARMASSNPATPAGIASHVATATEGAGPARAAGAIQAVMSQGTKVTDTASAVAEKKLNGDP